MQRRAAFYARVAAENPVALAQQFVQLWDYAQAHDYQMALVASDVGSGFDPERSGLKNILAGAEMGMFDVLLTRDPSRLFRDMAAFLACSRHLVDDCGIEIVFMCQSTNQAGDEA